MAAPDRDRPTTILYVAGDGRSGSTLLEGLLAAATGAVAVGETRMFLSAGFRWGARCGCGEPFTSCEFWAAVVDRAMPDTDPPSREAFERTGRGLVSNRRTRRLLDGPTGWSDEERAFAMLHVDLYRAIAAETGGRPIVDSSKTPAYGMFLAAQPELDVRVIHLVRDGRAVAHSWQRRKEWKATGADEERLMRQLSPRQAARQWAVQNAFCEVLCRRVDHAVRIRYEDLVADPATVVEATLAQLDVAASPVEPMTDHGFLGNPMRFDETPRDIVLDDAWRAEMAPGQRRLVTALALPLLLRHGYPLRAGRR